MDKLGLSALTLEMAVALGNCRFMRCLSETGHTLLFCLPAYGPFFRFLGIFFFCLEYLPKVCKEIQWFRERTPN
jgi:hypothetical protein